MAYKKQLRMEIRQVLKDLPEEVRKEESLEICRRIQESPQWQKCTSLLAFYPFREEVDLRPLILKSLQEGKSLYLPRMAQQSMQFHQISDLSHLAKNAWGIKEPSLDSPLWKGGKDALMLLPGLAFSLAGERIGWGGGFYDRWLRSKKESSQYPSVLAGVAYAEQLRESLPVDSWDIHTSHLATPEGFIPCN